jgi:hypothetical protein
MSGKIPARPVNRSEMYLAAILEELRAIRRTLAPPVAKQDEIKLREPKEK